MKRLFAGMFGCAVFWALAALIFMDNHAVSFDVALMQVFTSVIVILGIIIVVFVIVYLLSYALGGDNNDY